MFSESYYLRFHRLVVPVLVFVLVFVFFRLDKLLGIEERGELLQALGRQVVDVGATRREAQVQTLDVLANVEGILGGGSTTLSRQVESAQVAELHLLALEQLLQHTRGQLQGDAFADVLTVDAVVF